MSRGEGGGRPKKQVSEQLVETLASYNCSLAEIAAACNVDISTIQRRFAHAVEKGRENGKTSLKRKMYETAMNGNVVMMIWLSKQMLGYTDKVEQRNDTNLVLKDAELKTARNMAQDILNLVKTNASSNPRTA